ncbi:putative gustatory receptor 28b [Copidosoma floridanum]|uniref:putative gustatory receptor 28b n=1 Tax=Copidosoma floridanum TaxID=29053 RepID=UPI0006C93EF9|nr:putative gustatory receptor 28b [Copidosoma floridanum]
MVIFELDDHSYLKLLIRIFNVFGLAAFTLENRENTNPRTEPTFTSSKLLLAYNLLFISMAGYTNYFSVSLLVRRYAAHMTIFNIIDICSIILGTAVSVFILAYYCVRRDASIRLSVQMYRAKMLVSQLSPNRTIKSQVLVLVLVLIFHVVTSVCMACTAVLAEYPNWMLRFASAVRNFVVTSLFLQYAMVVRILLVMLERVNGTLENFGPVALFEASWCRSGSTEGLKRLQALSAIRSAHHTLYQICREVGKFYGFTVLGCIAYMFICLVVFSYFLIAILIERRINFAVIDYVHFLVWLVCFTASFVIMSTYITRVTEEMEKTGMIIHRLTRTTANTQILQELQDFSLHLLHVRVKFTAWELFTLDGTLVQSIFSSITTYLVILVQFKLSSVAKLQEKVNTGT